MMTGKDRLRQIVKASLAGLAQVARCRSGWVSSRPCLVISNYHSLDNRHRSGQVGADGLKTFGVVDERLYVSHDASIAH